MKKNFKQTCVCHNCGNEAEMEITCSLTEYESAVEKKEKKHENVKLNASGTCSQCGNEADMVINF
jgi:Fe2+ or Zn2+ uptake regulation protein